ncbi:YqeG family HAD IIIA-type phosphatase [Sporohalobacter salinus]|uniref:YqeG family HAD IIIA-type phosphatase n=1 Tax=Sporohalobacter salinus TaxID=1494606 RepID=UPI0019604D7E|nr:YqeG family HAD IIIA-type phosphatase [Sporohalobacter salinus]MBM7624673.1 HAD superfamily phosphatase (TIGR01668 family) [Sporohalobacter salinus]
MRLKDRIIDLCRPDFYYNNIYDIDLQELKELGINGLICDLDNTLLAWDDQNIESKIKEWIIQVEELGISVCILSNSLRTRVDRISYILQLPAISKALKPRKQAFKLAINKLNVNQNQIAVVGDQLFTDILGGNRLDLLTILVDPITNKEFISTKFIRLLEENFKKDLELFQKE